ncbi:hypothetical protein ACFWPX_29730 [Nocardia sp. NPDC058518]|uniref:hypothetical protein n=1 Tax=Nocardia sp. NPDC058518 TaxID=3346534 RepID=UPI0036481F53
MRVRVSVRFVQGCRPGGRSWMRTPPITQKRRCRLPARNRLLIALCHGDDDSDPICARARELVRLHGTRTDSPVWAAECDCRRVEFINQINELTATIHPSLALAHPQTIGELIDRMAAAAERAMRQLVAFGAQSEHMHRAWTQLAELALEYSDLVSHLFHVDEQRQTHQSTDTAHQG